MLTATEDKSLVSYYLTVINYHLEDATDFMLVVYQIQPNASVDPARSVRRLCCEEVLG